MAPTPVPPRPGDPDEVRVAIFDPAGEPPPASPLERVLPQLSGTAQVSSLRVEATHLRTPHDLIDPDSGGFLFPARLPHAQDRVTSAQLLSVLAAYSPEYWPDLVLFTSLDTLRDCARRRLILPIDQYLVGLLPTIRDPWPGAVDVFRYRGHAWGVPLAVQPLVLTYGPEFFSQAHLALPTDTWGWDQLLAVAKALTKTGPSPLVPDLLVGTFGFLATAPDSLPVFVWQAGGEVITGQGQQAQCALGTPAALNGERFVFDLIHRDQASPRQTPDGHWSGAAIIQLGPAIGTNFVLPPRGKEQVTGYSLSAATGLAVTAWARDPERAVRAAQGMASAVQGQYEWPVSRSAAAKLAVAGGRAATAVAALSIVHPPGLVADIRDAVESTAIAMANEIVTPSAATLNDQQLVQEAAKSACSAINKALQALP